MIKVSVSLDRFMTIKFRQWSCGFFKGKIVTIYTLLIGLIILILNSYTLATNGYINYTNGTEEIKCGPNYNEDWTIYYIFSQVTYFTLKNNNNN